ncbi:MAG TPA: tRNA pseudouridine synthase A [Holophagaceae bacterium]|nr:tRNA pseudouridine synthase A [Holophagaceae bacterium]
MKPPARTAPAPAAFRLLIEYEGSRFQGWQRQGEKQTREGVRTVAGSLEYVLHQAGVRVLELGGSGRTDAGVHALGQVAHLHLPKAQAPSARDLQRLFNDTLPHDISVRSVAPCPPAFHARHDAIERSYLYQLSRRRSAFAKPFIWWVKRDLDLRALEAAWAAFEGQHDLGAFADLEPGESPRCRILRCELAEQGSLVLLRVTASHFLRRQVRRMVGAAVSCALGEAHPGDIARDLSRPGKEANLAWSAKAAPAAGLFLERVRYKGDGETGALKAMIEVY